MKSKFDIDNTRYFLDLYHQQYNNPVFITQDPISVPHRYSNKEDIEISGFFSSLIAWGNRTSIIKSANKLMELMDNNPADFIRNHEPIDLKKFEKFCHRTLNSSDVQFFMTALQHIYLHKGGLEKLFSTENSSQNAFDSIANFRSVIFEIEHELRVEKHVSNPLKNSACKRLNMYLRWMVRSDNNGVDFGIWKSMQPSQLICPLDVHSARVARKLNLLTRKQNDRAAAEELTKNLSYFCADDPTKYDFALFGAGINNQF